MHLRLAVTIAFTFGVTQALQSVCLAQYSQLGPKLVGAGGSGTSFQGFDVAVSADGRTAVAGAPQDAGGLGAAWVWTSDGAAWSQQGAKLVGSPVTPSPSQGVQQGFAVAISADGDTLAVGGPADDAATGAVWVWTRSGGVWTQQGGRLIGSGAAGAGQQGHSVALSADGSTLAVGGIVDNGGVGAVWVWTRTAGTWSQQGAKLVASDFTGVALQGASVALSDDGNSLIVGGQGDGGGIGAAWIWTRTAGTWSQQGSKLVATGATGPANQGNAVAISGNGSTAIVGAQEDNSLVGAVFVWTRTGNVWSQQGSKLVGSGAVGTPVFGSSVSLSADGNTAVVGGEGDDSHAGAAWAWRRQGSTWTEVGPKLVGTGEVGAAHRGRSAAISADASTVVVGGFSDNGQLGAAWVFAATGQPPAEPSNPNPADNARLGSSPAVLDWADTPGASSYDVMIDGALAGTTTTSRWTVGALRLGARSWRVVAKNGFGATSGPVWRFLNGIAAINFGATRLIGTIPVSIASLNSTIIDPAATTWVVVHGRGDHAGSDAILRLARAIQAARPRDQVLTLDWRAGADDDVLFVGEDWIRPVAEASASALGDYGFSSDALNLIGHSWGSYVSAEIAESLPASTPCGVRSLVALDPPLDVMPLLGGGLYNPEAEGEIDFFLHACRSWAFRTSAMGSPLTATTADEAFWAELDANPIDGHKLARAFFVSLLSEQADPSSPGAHFRLDRLVDDTPGPWLLDRFSAFGERSSGGPFEGVVHTTDGIASRVDCDCPFPSNFRVLTNAPGLTTLAWSMPISTSPTLGLVVEGGRTPTEILGSIPLPLTPEGELRLPAGTWYVRLRTTGDGAPRVSNVVTINVATAEPPSAPVRLQGLVNGSTVALTWKNTFLGGSPDLAVLHIVGTPTPLSIPLGKVERFDYPAVPPGTYAFRVSTSNAFGQSRTTSPLTLTFPGPCNGSPRPVANVAAYYANNRLTVSWESAPEGPATTSVLISSTGTFEGSIEARERLSVLAPTGRYELTVSALNACGASQPSARYVVIVP